MNVEVLAETWKQLLEYFDFRRFLADNSLLKLAFILVFVCALAAAVHLLSPWLQRRLESFTARRYHLGKSGKSDKSGKTGGGERPGAPEGIPGSGAEGPAALNAMDFAMFERVFRNAKRLLYLGILSWGAHMLDFAPVYAAAVDAIFSVICTLAAILLVVSLVPFNLDLYMRRHGATLKTSHSRALLPIVEGVIWAVGLTFLLDNLGFHVSTIIAGLGIMGVAVGLAGQAILSDFFSYIVILLDKPFRIGDFVVLSNGKAGDVEYMGPKTTHLRSLDDDLIVCANSEMTKGVLVNQGNIRERPVILEIGVAFETPMSRVRRVPDILREVIESFPQCTFDRCCMLGFGEANYQFQLLYVVRQQPGGIRAFMLTRSDVNMAIQERLDAEQIPGAYQTSHVFLTDQPGGLLGGDTGGPAAPGGAGAGRGQAVQAQAGQVAAQASPLKAGADTIQTPATQAQDTQAQAGQSS